MHLKWLGIYCDVVRAGSFSKAAKENQISQSAASQVVLQLEQRLGVKLIDRSKRPWVVTDEGRYFYDGSRKIVQQYEDLESQVRSLRDEVAGRIRVASIYSVGLSHMNSHVKDFLRRYPRAEVQLQYEHPDRVYELIDLDLADLGLVSYPKASRRIAAEPWREEPMVLVCAPTHFLATKKLLAPADLDGLDVVGFEKDLKIRQVLDRELAAYGVSLKIVVQFDNTENIKRAIEADAGVGLLPEPTVVREIQLGALVAIPVLNKAGLPAMKRPLGIIYRRSKRLSSTTQRFIRELQDREPPLDGQTAASVAANNHRASNLGTPAVVDAANAQVTEETTGSP